MRAVLIQSTDLNYHADLLSFTTPIHTAYAQKHGFDYWCIRGNLQPPTRHVFWNKMCLIAAAFAFEVFDLAVWLDADALIVDHNADLRDAMPDGAFLGMTIAPEWSNAPLNNYHLAGVYYAKYDPRTFEFFKEASLRWHEWNDEWVFNNIIHDRPDLGPGVASLDSRWHAVRQFHDTKSAVVLGFHGQGDGPQRLAEMKQAAEERGLLGEEWNSDSGTPKQKGMF